MANSQEHWDNVRAQFDVLPYPNQPLDYDPIQQPSLLAKHNYVLAHYRRYQAVVSTQGKWILDAGCGSGVKLLALARANPGAQFVGIDISPKSIDLAQQRFAYHGLADQVELHCLPVEAVASLPHRFDYINCDDVLYLLAEPAAGLKAMKAVLNPQGLIRVNMHSAIQRAHFYRVQDFLTRLGYLVGAPTPEEMSITRQTMATLAEWVTVKQVTWKAEFAQNDEQLLMNYLFRGDKGVTMTEFCALLREAELAFVSMVNWREWNLETLFKNVEDLPIAVALGLAEMSPEEQIQIYELLHPIHRLLDLYCGHAVEAEVRSPLADWASPEWQRAVIHLHPQLKTQGFKAALEASPDTLGRIAFDQHLKIEGQGPMAIDSAFAGCLYALLGGPQTMTALIQRWLKIHPLHPITLQPTPPPQGFAAVRNFVMALEAAGYVMVELQPEASLQQ